MQLLHIFRPGQHAPMSGSAIDFSEADLAASAKAYDPALHEAPVVIGHPKHDSPAYGWVKSMAANSKGLFAAVNQIDAAFAELVRVGKYKKISASFYTPDSPSNPVPGVYYLRHVGFLGAQPPAVKGLKQAEFAEAETGIVEFSDWGMETNAGLWRRMREWMLTKFGMEVADQVIPTWQIDSMAAAAAADDDDPASFADPTHATTQKDADVLTQQLAAENAALKKQLADAQAEKDAAARKRRHDENTAFAEGLIASGQLAPKHKDAVVAFMDFSENDGAVEFGEGAQKRPLGAAFRDFLGDMPKVVEFSEVATKDRATRTGVNDTVDYGENVDQERLALDQRIRQYMHDHKVDYATAAGRVPK